MATTDPAASTTTNTLGSLASLAPLIINMLKGSSQPDPGALLGSLPGGQNILNGVVGQQQQQAPLRQAVTQQAMNMLPNSAFPGGRPALAPVGAGPAPVAASNNSGLDIAKLLGAGAAGGGIGAALAKLLGGGAPGGGSFDLGKILKALGFGDKTPAAPINTGYFDGNGNFVHDASGGGVMPDLPGAGTPLGGPSGWGTPNVDTSYDFNGDPTLSAYQPPDFSTLPGYGTPLPTIGGGVGDGGNAWDE